MFLVFSAGSLVSLSHCDINIIQLQTTITAEFLL